MELHLHLTIRPGIINFTLTAAQLVMDVTVTEKGITLNTLQGSNNPNVLSNIIGSTLKLDELIKLMRNTACDVFPSDDAFCYTESSCEKNYVMEMHIYSCMAYFASSHNFAWSRWNFQAGSRTAIFLMRELLEHRKLVRYWSFKIENLINFIFFFVCSLFFQKNLFLIFQKQINR